MTRVISGAVLAAVALAAILFLPAVALRALACAVALLAELEYQKIARTTAPPLGFLVCWFVSGGQGEGFLALPTVMAVSLVYQVMARNTPIQSAAAGALGALYVGLPLGLLAAVHGRAGASSTLFLIATVAVSDTAQYYSGRTFGRRPLAPAISPKKTVEGAFGGVVIGTLFVVIVSSRLFGQPPLPMALFGAVAVVLGIIGDLFESRLKRAADLKDSSNLIPGHGGVLDRIDALLFVAPLFWAFFPL